jgi:hypothetical protein
MSKPGRIASRGYGEGGVVVRATRDSPPKTPRKRGVSRWQELALEWAQDDLDKAIQGIRLLKDDSSEYLTAFIKLEEALDTVFRLKEKQL